ncbi:protocadherin gamma-A5-like isoform X5 [Hemibagrus wyckioides]|uniref:protocadherin gamma-A5-like isoform X5 n=1 Tax=Hemibagrus wyckioides TaxID=337641 RepID=UPI00266C736D|nr:protocadherin gamma-A5-like isoform X5 [Hemibagrus wyckioides]
MGDSAVFIGSALCPGQNGFASKAQLHALTLFLLTDVILGQIRYSIPEEMKKGSFVGNVAEDLGFDARRMKAGGARIVSGDSSEFIGLDLDKGFLVVGERIDRERLCGQTSPCSLSLEIIITNPMQLHSVVIEIFDINDNYPTFTEKEVQLEVSESTQPGTLILHESAIDRDIGKNSLQGYTLHPTDKFNLKIQTGPDGKKYAELYLHSPLDREEEDKVLLTLTAVDGGEPQRSSTLKIRISVLDANDNAPVFTQKEFKATVPENAPKDSTVMKVTATDADEDAYGRVTYHFNRISADISDVFAINENSGEITVAGLIDYEEHKYFEIAIQAKDYGGLIATAKILIEVVDVNDNAPIISLTSFSSPISEDSPSGVTVAIVNVKDLDSGNNGKVRCSINEKIPFTIKSSFKNYYTLLTDGTLDRENTYEYNITFLAVDEGIPPLSSIKTVTLKISDVNDNQPIFEESFYSVSLMENNSPGVSICSVKAKDLDWNQNAKISYMLIEGHFNAEPLSSYISVNAESGAIHAVRSVDYEQTKSIEFLVKAQDAGSPSQSSNVTVKINIQDQNDNAPQILYPVQTGISVVAEMVPRSADVGYLVTKVVAVDVDSGQNAWLSYKLHKAADRALFEVGLQNGEIRTVRQVTDKDAVKQKLTVVVEDNGQPSRSATVNVNVVVADTFPEVLSKFTDFTHEKEYNDNLTFYLVLALAVVSFLFIVSIIAILSVKCYRWRRERMFYKSGANLPVIPYYPPLYADVGGTGTLQHMYNYESYSTADPKKSNMKFTRPPSESAISLDTSGTQTLTHAHMGKPTPVSDHQQKPPNADWRFNQNQRPGPSGAAATPEVAMGTGPWPNPPTEAEQLQALMAAANEVSEATNTLGPGTMGLSTRYSPQFTLQHVPDYRQNVYIPGSTATLSANPQQPQQPQQPPQALPAPQVTSAQVEPPKAQTPASKKKITKKEKK